MINAFLVELVRLRLPSFETRLGMIIRGANGVPLAHYGTAIADFAVQCKIIRVEFAVCTVRRRILSVASLCRAGWHCEVDTH